MAVLNPPRTMFEVFEGLPEGTLCQIINNQLVMSLAPSYPHQDTTGEIFSQMVTHVKTKKLGKVLISPFDVYFDKENVFQPDTVFVANENTHLIKRKGLFGAPDLVIEVLSPETKNYDLGEKKDVYERYGVKEYWLVDPDTKEVYFFKLVNDAFVEIKSSEGNIESPLLQTVIKF